MPYIAPCKTGGSSLAKNYCKRLMKKLLFGLSLIMPGLAIAQTDSSGMIPVVDARKNSIEQASNILNGKNHIAYPSSIEGSGYLLTEWVQGSVVYEDVQYNGVQLKYDQYKDELILLHPNGLPVILFTPRVSSFSFLNRNFINLSTGSLPNSGSESGFYEVLVKGNISLLAKRKKLLDEFVQNTGVVKTFMGKTEYLALKDGKIYKIKKESNLLDLIPEKKQGAKSLLRQNDINYNNNPESALLTIAEYYNQSSN
jgi:hypothetical protein